MSEPRDGADNQVTMSDDETYAEQRRYARHPGPFDGWCVGDEHREVRIMNLGLGGCFIMVGSGTQIGTRFQLKVDLSEEGLLDVTATTLYHTTNGSAVTFVNLTPGAYEQIQRTVGMSWAPRDR